MKNLYIPQSLTGCKLEMLLSNSAYSDYASNQKFVHYCYYFIHLIIKGNVQSNQNDGYSYTRLSSVLLKKAFGKNSQRKIYYQNVINILREVGIIEVDESYSTDNGKCKGYRLTVDYETSIITLQTTIEVKEEDNPIDDPIHYENIGKLTFDSVKYENVLSKLYYTEKLHTDLSLLRLQAKDLYVVKKNGRVYSNFTNVSRKFRGCFTYNGMELYNVDLSNAFQFFMIKLLLESFNCTGPLKQYEGIIPDDVYYYIHCVCNGTFVEAMAKTMRITFDLDEFNADQRLRKAKRSSLRFYCKSRFKQQLFSKVYFNQLRKNHNPYSKAFEKLYPTVWSFIRENKIVDYKYLSNQLPQIESEVMEAALNTLYKAHPDCLFIRLHDCIITTEQYAIEAENAIKEACLNTIGYEPKLNYEKVGKETDEILNRNPNDSFFKVMDQFEFREHINIKLHSLYKQYWNGNVVSDKMDTYLIEHRHQFQSHLCGSLHGI